MNINNFNRSFLLIYKKNIRCKLLQVFYHPCNSENNNSESAVLKFNKLHHHKTTKKISFKSDTQFFNYYSSFYYKDKKSKKNRLKMSEKCKSNSILLRLIASSVTIANRSGIIIREVMSGGNLQIVDKGINDLQTEADRRVQKCIIASLHHKFPNLTVIGEEEQTHEDSEWIEEGENEEIFEQEANFPPGLLSTDIKDMCVWVDPLDGTNEYTKGHLDHVTVLIGIAINGKALAGIIHQPYYKHSDGGSSCGDGGGDGAGGGGGGGGVKLGRTIWGVVGLGAFGLSRQPPPSDCRRIVTTRSHETDLVRMAVDACNASEVIKIGGAGFKVLYLIEGKAHAYIFANTGCKKWDTCAPEAVLRSVGGVLTDVRGSPINYGANQEPANAGGIVATSSEESHRWYIERIPEAVKTGLNV